MRKSMTYFQPALCPMGAELTMYMALEGARLNCPRGSPADRTLRAYHAEQPLALEDAELERAIRADQFLAAMITEEP
jgi:hypothetical protein